MKNKFLSIVVVSFLLIANAFSQEQKPFKIHELGLTFANLDNFGIRYKTGNEKTLLRITMLAMHIGSDNDWGREIDSTSYKSFGYGAGVRIGFEKPINIVKNFNLYYGLDVTGSFNYLRDKSEGTYYPNNDTIWSISSGIAFVFGGTYCLGDHFRFSAEISPSLQYTYGEQKRNGYENRNLKTNEIDFGFSNYGASITVAYRFKK